MRSFTVQSHCSSNCMMWSHSSVKQAALLSILSQLTASPLLGTQVLLLVFSLIPTYYAAACIKMFLRYQL